MSEWCFAAKLGSAQLSCADVLAHRLPLQPYPKTGAHACWVSSSVRRERARMVARIRGAFALGVWARAFRRGPSSLETACRFCFVVGRHTGF